MSFTLKSLIRGEFPVSFTLKSLIREKFSMTDTSILGGIYFNALFFKTFPVIPNSNTNP